MNSLSRRPRKGDRLVYTGPYAPGVTAFYGPGTVVGFRKYGRVVTVHLDDGDNADWPVDDVAPADPNSEGTS